MKVAFAPVGKDNPYQEKLIGSLGELGVEVLPVKSGILQFFKTKHLFQVDIIHFHWFEYYTFSKNAWIRLLKWSIFLIGIFLIKGNKKYVWTVHNFGSHESGFSTLDNFFTRCFIRMQDAFSVHNFFSKGILETRYKIPNEKIAVIPHANYVGTYPQFKGNIYEFRRNIRNFDESKFSFMFLGDLRPYKGIMDIIDAFISLKRPKAQLIICGRVKFEKDLKVINEKIAFNDNIIFLPRYIEDGEIEAYFSLSNVMIYPYKRVVTSGALLLGMSYSKLCLASNVGSMPEFIDHEFLFGDVPELTKMMDKVMNISSEEVTLVGRGNFEKIKDHTWVSMAEKTLELYHRVNFAHS
ncbi:glycosyltransferase [Parapedobacter sp. GCM10030251]|uniref:glycosyltransferase n=1 Tax=Parapedobacter sp. GCM10030251 TaxID=3273419 RepID=UPI0036192078